MVAGWLARENQWRRLDSRIQKSLAFENRTLQKRITRYHASEMNGDSGEFSGWENERQRKLRMTLKLFKAVSNRQMYGISCGADADAYFKVYPGTQLADVYVLCLQTVMTFIATACEELLSPEDRVLIIHDKGNWDGEALRGYRSMVDDRRWGHRHRFVGIEGKTGKQDVCLQAADMIAFESFKEADNLLFRNEKTRAALEALLKLNGAMYGRYFDLETLQALKAADDDDINNGTDAFDKGRTNFQADSKFVKAAMKQEKQERQAERKDARSASVSSSSSRN